MLSFALCVRLRLLRLRNQQRLQDTPSMIYEQSTPRAAPTCPYHDIEQLAPSDMQFYQPEPEPGSSMSETDSASSDLYLQQVRKRHHRMVLGTCAVVIGIGLVLMIFIPRLPVLNLSKAVVQFDPYFVNQTVLIHNPNFYPVTLYDLRLTVTEASIGELPIPPEWRHREVIIPRHSYKTIHVDFPAHFRISETELMHLCMSRGGLHYVTKGEVGMRLWFRDLGKHELGPWDYSQSCE